MYVTSLTPCDTYCQAINHFKNYSYFTLLTVTKEMLIHLKRLPVVLPLLTITTFLAVSCSGKTTKDTTPIDSQTTVTDTVIEKNVPVPGDTDYVFSNKEEIIDFLKHGPDSAKYNGSVILSAAEYAPEYAGKLIQSRYDRFIVVDKARMKVLLYDKYGQELKQYGMACGKGLGTKHVKADCRTPEGFFSVEGKYDSTDWLYTDDDGVTSEKKGQFGPRFIRIKIPNTSQIGIHGTCSPWSIGHRASHGCIRIENENILELVDYVEKGMPVIVLPGKRDRAVNREEGYEVAYFPTDPETAMSASELALRVNPVKKDFSKKDNPKPADSTATEIPMPDVQPAADNDTVPMPDEAETN